MGLPSASTQEDANVESILAKSAHGAKFLIVLQVASRALTFAANQILLRYISPELLGIATQLEVYVISVLYFARESLRLAIQRQRDSSAEQHATNDGTGEGKESQGRRRKLLSADRSQVVVNLAYISLVLGILIATGLGWVYLRSQGSNSSMSNIPFFRESLALCAVAAIVELASEPLFVVAQQKSEYKIRAAAESCGTLLRCLVTCGLMIVASNAELHVGVIPFAIGQFAFSLGIFLVYYWKVAPIAKYAGFSLLPKPLKLESGSMTTLSYLSMPLFNLAISLFVQGIVKHILTQGDVIMISLMASLPAQGMYALVSNYGGLVARMVFQPIEESSRSYFGKLLSTIDGKPSVSSMKAASRDLSRLLRVYCLLSICAVVVGPSVAPILLRVVVGSRWSNTGAGDLLAKYCYYIPLLAFNGVLESFVSVVASKAELNRQSVWMLGFSVAFASTGYIFLHRLDLGATGLVYANMANMLVRIAWCYVFIKNYLRQNIITVTTAEILPTWSTMALAAATLSVFYQASVQGDRGDLRELVLLGSISACFLLLLTIFERDFLKQCYRSTRTPAPST